MCKIHLDFPTLGVYSVEGAGVYTGGGEGVLSEKEACGAGDVLIP